MLPAIPAGIDEASGRRIHDRYVIGTRLRLRRVDPLAGGAPQYKLGQKDTPDPTALWRMRHTSIYLSRAEYDVLAALPAHLLDKRRYTLELGGVRYGIDVFDGRLSGLVLAEVGADSEDELARYAVPEFAVAEVSDDRRFTGGALAAASDAEAEAIAAYASRSG